MTEAVAAFVGAHALLLGLYAVRNIFGRFVGV